MSSNQVQNSTKTILAQGVIKGLSKGAKKTTHPAVPKTSHRNRFLSFDRQPNEVTTKWIRVETPMSNFDFQDAATKLVNAVAGTRMTRIESISVTKLYRYREPEMRMSTTGIFEIPFDVVLDDLKEYFQECDITEIQFQSQ